MKEFETLFEKDKISLLRYINFRLNCNEDTDDVMQEVCLTAFQKFNQLKDKSCFKAWLIQIAKNKCNDYFRKKSMFHEVSDKIPENNLSNLSNGKYGIYDYENNENSYVKETFNLLDCKDKQILYLYFWKNMKQKEIAEKLKIPTGTVKSRLFNAKKNFKNQYYNLNFQKGESKMKNLPEFLPAYKIEKTNNEPFTLKWEELMGWFIVPKQNERLSWGIYDMPSRKCDKVYNMAATRSAKVHGIQGVEIIGREFNNTDKNEITTYNFIAQLTDTHCRFLAAVKYDKNFVNYLTFLDGEEFNLNWGFGDNNCGKEINLSRKGFIQRKENQIQYFDKTHLLDIVGRYNITIFNKIYDTVCVMEITDDIAIEQFLDKNGKTILWRRFNRDNWAIENYKTKWSERLPENEQLIINEIPYVHWYDCITDYVV